MLFICNFRVGCSLWLYIVICSDGNSLAQLPYQHLGVAVNYCSIMQSACEGTAFLFTGTDNRALNEE